MSYTATQTRMSKIMQEVSNDLYGVYGSQATTHINTYLSSNDLVSDLSSLRSNLKAVIDSFSDDVNSHIAVHGAINKVLVAAEAALADANLGTATFYHSEDEYTHSFYKCDSPEDDTPELLYTVTPDLASFTLAENICSGWANSNLVGDFYGSYTNSCLGAQLLMDPYSACLAGRDHLTIV